MRSDICELYRKHDALEQRLKDQVAGAAERLAVSHIAAMFSMKGIASDEEAIIRARQFLYRIEEFGPLKHPETQEQRVRREMYAAMQNSVVR